MLRPVLLALLLAPALSACILDDKLDDTGGLDSDSALDSEAPEDGPLHWPTTEGWTDPGVPGWMGRTLIATSDGAWQDNDGVDPGLPGCHTLHATDAAGTCDGEVLERIGEACHTFTRGTEERHMLVETNPGPGECHPHTGGEGHPDVFDCALYCQGTVNLESGAFYSEGACEEVEDETCAGGPQASAYCACWG